MLQTRLDYDGMIEDTDKGAACSDDDVVNEDSSPHGQVGRCDYLTPVILELGSIKQCICVAGADKCRLQEE